MIPIHNLLMSFNYTEKKIKLFPDSKGFKPILFSEQSGLVDLKNLLIADKFFCIAKLKLKLDGMNLMRTGNSNFF